MKLLKSPFLAILQTFFYSKCTQKEIGHSKGTQTSLEGHSKDTWELGHSRHLGSPPLEGHTSTHGTWALGHSDTWAPGHSKCTWALEALDALCLADSNEF